MIIKIKKIISSLCKFIGAICIIFGIFYGITMCYNIQKNYIHNKTVLVVDFSKKYSEISSNSILDEVFDVTQMDFKQLIEALSMAANDSKIDALVAKIDISGMEFAQIQDVAGIIKAFKNTGKKTYVFSQGFGSLGKGNREYYLASFFDEIYMQPHTTIGLTGISIEIPFMRNLLDKVGIYPEFYQRYEYKSAMMSFTDNHISPFYERNMKSLGDSLMNTLIRDIALNRNIKPENIKEYINLAPLSAEKGKELGLIDGVLYYTELEDMLRRKGSKNFLSLQNYAAHISPNSGYLPVIAYLNLSGIIDSGESYTDLNGDFSIGSTEVVRDIEDIKNLPNLKALIVRIDSPGGSYYAADEIYFALQALKKEKNIPIIVSQSGYAASGGYYISLAGDTIIAQPTTITGSIGVLGGKFVLDRMWKKLNIRWANINFGKNADILSINKPFSAAEKQIFNNSLDEIYKDFTSKVSENRKLTADIEQIARGRVWTGEQALEFGLIDKLGGIATALHIAKEKANIEPTERFIISSYPKKKTLSEKINALLSEQNIRVHKILERNGVDISYLKLFKRMQYDTVLPILQINM